MSQTKGDHDSQTLKIFTDKNATGEIVSGEKALFENQISCEWLTTEQAALYLGISANALRICVHRDQVQAFKFGRRLRFRLTDLRGIPLKKGTYVCP